jgi:excisionase family DNA binding protein
MTAEELAKVLNVSRLTILRRAKRGTIPSFRVGSCVRFDPANISKWLVEMGVKRMSKP